MSARNKHGAKFKRRQQREIRKGMNKLPVYLVLDDYICSRWGVSKRQAKDWRAEGKINVNGEVQVYPRVEKRLIELDELGRLRIMVEGVPDPRPAQGALVLGK